jgi:hypothetical protein
MPTSLTQTPRAAAPVRAPGAPGAGPARFLALPFGMLGVAVGCLLPWRKALQTGLFDDVFWHRAAGTWMLDHHRVMTHDLFSYTATGHRWATPEWGYDVVLAGSVRLVGPVGFWLLSAGVASLTVVAVALRSRLVGAGWTVTGLLCVETSAAVTLFLDDRPQVVSYLLVALLLLLLALARRRRGVLVAVPVLFVLWANLHGSFLLGLLVLALEALAARFPWRVGRVGVTDPLPVRTSALLLLASGAATLVNPFGLGVYRSAFAVTFNPTVRRLIGEWQSPDFHDPATLALVVLPLVATVATFAFTDRTVPAVELALASFLLISTLDASRFLPYFAIIWCAMAARCPPVPEEQLRPNLLVAPMVAVLGFAFLHGPWLPAGQAAGSVPVRAVAYLQSHPGRVFSTYLWNDYLDLKRIPVFVDGRTELYTSSPVLTEYLAVDGVTTDPDPILRRYGVRYVLWPPHTALSLYLLHDPAWRVVRRSGVSIVFRRVAPGTAAPGATGARPPKAP